MNERKEGGFEKERTEGKFLKERRLEVFERK